jgi:pimeloyl-ACP methyl ester carboxylesterase
MDHGRDLLHMVNHFREEMPLPIIGIGHSVGTVGVVNLSLMHPRLLTTVILLDTVIRNHHTNINDSSAPTSSNSNSNSTTSDNITLTHTQGLYPTKASTFRRDLWPSRAAAAASFSKAGFYQSWDPRVLERWLVHGLRDTPTALYPTAPAGSVTLTTTKHQEVLTYLRQRFAYSGVYDAAARRAYPDMEHGGDPGMPFYRPEAPGTFTQLPSLRPSALYLFGDTSPLNPPDVRKENVDHTGIGIGGSGGVEEERVRGEALQGLGHLLAMEDPGRCADLAAPWIGAELKRWRKEQEAWREWTKRPQMEKITVSEQWKKTIKGKI